MHTVTPTLFDHRDGSRTVFSTLNGERVLTVASRTEPPVANLLLVHGLGDYPARHIQNARHLATLGYRTVMVGWPVTAVPRTCARRCRSTKPTRRRIDRRTSCGGCIRTKRRRRPIGAR